MQQQRLLVIDHEENHCNLIERAVQHALPPVKLIQAVSGQQAIDYLLDQACKGAEMPHLILLNGYLPTRQVGLQTLTQMKRLPEPINFLPVVVLVIPEEVAHINDFYQGGANSCVEKPTSYQGWVELLTYLGGLWLEPTNN